MSGEPTVTESQHRGDESSDGSDEIELTETFDRSRPPRLGKFGRCAAQVLWPAFMGAAMSVGLFFSAIDPLEIEVVGVNLGSSRPAAYTLGFFMFWMLFIVSGTITWFLANGENEKAAVSDSQ